MYIHYYFIRHEKVNNNNSVRIYIENSTCKLLYYVTTIVLCILIHSVSIIILSKYVQRYDTLVNKKFSVE